MLRELLSTALMKLRPICAQVGPLLECRPTLLQILRLANGPVSSTNSQDRNTAPVSSEAVA